MTLFFLSLCPWRKALAIVILALGLFAASAGSIVRADDTNAAPVTPADQGKISQYLVDHQAELGPFFEQHQDALVKQAVPVLLNLIGTIVMINLAISWPFDVGLGYGYSFFFAPLYAKIRRALVYASVRLALSVALAVLSGTLLFVISAVSPLLVLPAFILLAILNVVVQIIWVGMMYRTPVSMSVLFYVALILTHAVLGCLVSFPLMKGRINATITQFLDQNVTSQLKLAVTDAKHDLATATETRDKTKADVTQTQTSLDEANQEQATLKQEIEQKKNSEAFIYSRVVRFHAQGDLNGAHAALTDFLAKFPNGALKSAAQAQLTQVESELAAQETQRKQAEADAATAAAAARADLLARAAKGQVTLSEMRHALIGKNRNDVMDLLGKPTATDSDKWGYGQKMILDPMTQKVYGLTVNFSEGTVQGVDYFYGAAQ